MNKKELEDAVRDFDKTIELDSSFVDALMNRGKAKMMLLDKEGACSDWKKALELGDSKASELMKQNCI